MKFWLVYTHKNDGRLNKFDTKDAAMDHAKRLAHSDAGGDPVFILETIAMARRPVPDVEVSPL